MPLTLLLHCTPTWPTEGSCTPCLKYGRGTAAMQVKFDTPWTGGFPAARLRAPCGQKCDLHVVFQHQVFTLCQAQKKVPGMNYPA